jgi:biopolymer transport protein ExbB
LKRFRERLQDGKLDRGKALDLCELNPSPASRVALAAVKRWGRPAADLERAVALASKVETDRLRRNVGTLRRVAALAPLLGLLGSLIAAGRALSVPGAAWGPALANSLIPLTSGVALAILALVIYDGLAGRVEKLANTIDRLGAETVDAIALSAPTEAPTTVPHRPVDIRRGPHGPIRPTQPIRVEIPENIARSYDRDDDYEN